MEVGRRFFCVNVRTEEVVEKRAELLIDFLFYRTAMLTLTTTKLVSAAEAEAEELNYGKRSTAVEVEVVAEAGKAAVLLCDETVAVQLEKTEWQNLSSDSAEFSPVTAKVWEEERHHFRLASPPSLSAQLIDTFFSISDDSLVLQAEAAEEEEPAT
ncbi:hypothetical protein G4B88_007516 [Cannabis sativa]|uniref:Uncharacterized protein n=1 Tax=Cannabis sativa TaxID=3483 RepID=A0A7J6HAH0_CANSA|nr:hypothetical protein G4B88_007516 [Cannabis sativa]